MAEKKLSGVLESSGHSAGVKHLPASAPARKLWVLLFIHVNAF